MPGINLALGVISFAHQPLGWIITRPHSFQLSPPFLVEDRAGRWGWKTLSTGGRAVIQLLVWVDKPGCRAGKTYSRIRIGHICTPPSFLVRVSLQLGSADEQNQWLGLLLGTSGMNPICQDPHAGCYKCHPLAHPSPLLCHSQIPSG